MRRKCYRKNAEYTGKYNNNNNKRSGSKKERKGRLSVAQRLAKSVYSDIPTPPTRGGGRLKGWRTSLIKPRKDFDDT